MSERQRLSVSDIEAQLLIELWELPSLRGTQSVRVRSYNGPRDWTWELDRIEPEVPPDQFANVMEVVGRLQQQYDLNPDV
jgi:hypothetical protein